ncbi:MAG TPA: 4Fe-4S dicluster domain-containing protein [Syntrophales bacterium]|nr:4Fe-4S dicluster domain-containing protein [Syntrophales bacterium]
MTSKLKDQALKDDIIRFCTQRGADLVGFAPVDRWDEYDEVPPQFRPGAIFPQARTVIVLGMSMPLPVMETTPSALHKELYDTTNRQLDNLAVELTRYLNRLGHASFPFTRDTYTSMRALRENNMAAFGHVPAARYAGLGTIGMNQCILTPEFGPRVRFVSVFTAAEIPADPMQPKELCIKCKLCAESCPKSAITPREDRVIGDYDKTACLEMHEELVRRRCFPCGICTKVCPIGKDRRLYKSKGARKKYQKEKETLAANPDAPEYSSWQHIRKYGIAHKPKEPLVGKK